MLGRHALINVYEYYRFYINDIKVYLWSELSTFVSKWINDGSFLKISLPHKTIYVEARTAKASCYLPCCSVANEHWLVSPAIGVRLAIKLCLGLIQNVIGE